MPDGRALKRGNLGLAKRRGVNLRHDTLSAVERISESTGYAVGVILRECIESGLPVVRDRYRTARRRAAGQAANGGADAAGTGAGR